MSVLKGISKSVAEKKKRRTMQGPKGDKTNNDAPPHTTRATPKKKKTVKVQREHVPWPKSYDRKGYPEKFELCCDVKASEVLFGKAGAPTEVPEHISDVTAYFISDQIELRLRHFRNRAQAHEIYKWHNGQKRKMPDLKKIDPRGFWKKAHVPQLYHIPERGHPSYCCDL